MSAYIAHVSSPRNQKKMPMAKHNQTWVSLLPSPPQYLFSANAAVMTVAPAMNGGNAFEKIFMESM